MQCTSRRALLVAAATWLLGGCSYGMAGQVPYSVGVSGEGNQVRLVQDTSGSAAAYVAIVQSARGIGQANFAWWGVESPHPFLFYLELSGLELFSLTWADKTVSVHVNSTDLAITQSLRRQDAAEAPLNLGSPEWIRITLPTAERPGFWLTVPDAFVQEAPRVWAIAWVDFYR